MKPGRKKPERDEAGTESPLRETTGSDKSGIDAIRVLQLIAGGLAALLLVWIILRSVLHMI